MYTFLELQKDRNLWSDLKIIPVVCSWCNTDFEMKFGTLYNVIRRGAAGIYCTRTCAGSARTFSTQKKYQLDGGKTCKRCNEFKELKYFSPLPTPPYFRSECQICHNFKPARKYSLLREKVQKQNIDFALNLDEFLEVATQNCFYCNSEMKTLNLERVNQEQGFIYQNVISCCKTCLKFKSDLEHERFINLCIVIARNFQE